MPPNHLIFCHPLLLTPSIFPSIRSFPVSQFFTPGSQSIRASASASVLLMNVQDWFPFDWLVGSPYNPRDSQASSPTPQFKNINSSALSFQLLYPYVTTGKTIALTRWTFVVKVMSLLFNMLSRLVIYFLPRSKHLLIPWPLSPSAVILEPPQIKPFTVSIVSPYA